jgi:hypothetical protein
VNLFGRGLVRFFTGSPPNLIGLIRGFTQFFQVNDGTVQTLNDMSVSRDEISDLLKLEEIKN